MSYLGPQSIVRYRVIRFAGRGSNGGGGMQGARNGRACTMFAGHFRMQTKWVNFLFSMQLLGRRLIVGYIYADESKGGTLFVKDFLTHAQYDQGRWKV